jgi:serine/threonine protein kinase
MLPALEQQYQYVDVDHPHDPVPDNDDASLGEGAFGEVFLLKGRFQDELFAVKLLKLRKVKNAGVSTDTLRQEAANLRRLTHPNIIRMWAECQEDKGKFYGIVMEFAAGGSVQTHIQKAGGKTVPQSKRWFEELCAGLHHMHQECRMQHRDVKPQNLLLGNNDRLKIADLGLACAYQTAQSLSKQGTSLYMSPEKASGQKYGTMDDMWAAGCILLELLRGEGIGLLCPAGLGLSVSVSAGHKMIVSDLTAVLKDRDCFPAAEEIVARILQVLSRVRLCMVGLWWGSLGVLWWQAGLHLSPPSQFAPSQFALRLVTSIFDRSPFFVLIDETF